MSVNINPLPAWARNKKFRSMPPPYFPDGAPSREDVELAIALFAELDPESQLWYGGPAFVERLRAKLSAMSLPSRSAC